MAKYFLLFFVVLNLVGFTKPAWADCASPTALEGEMIYNESQKNFQYCADTSWIRATPDAGSGSGGCSSPTGAEGEIIYNADQAIMQGCGGATWLPMGPPAPRWISVDNAKGYGRHTCGIKFDG